MNISNEIEKYLSQLILSLPKFTKIFIAILFDISCCVFSLWISYYLRLGEISSLNERGFAALLISLITFIPIFTIFGLHRAVFRYSGFFASFIVLKASLIYGLIYSMLITVYGFSGIPRTIGLIQPFLFFAFTLIWRILVSYFLGGIYRRHWKSSKDIKALIYGAGNAGRQLFKAIEDSKDIYIQGFLDDNKAYHGRFINGKMVYPSNKLKRQINEKGINLILLAIPSASRSRRMKIIKKLRQYKVAVRTIPGISDIARGSDTNNYFQDLTVDDLLEREKIEPFNNLMKKNINSKVVLVTGAGGSIGSELCRQILNFNPSTILMIEINEYALYSIHAELNELKNKFKNKNVELIPLLASINDKRRMNRIISTWKPSTIYHTAAYKHVPLVEHNLIEGLKNNIFGTLSMTELAIKNNVSDFVFISTDKAVRPTNIMGASKRISELVLQAKFHRTSNSNTKFSIVRFGNVLESSGSVIPKFREQIRSGGPVTLTHKKITRYFMTINEAAELVIQAGAMAKGGEVFVLDMGKPVKILNLAERMIELSGLEIKNELNPNGDIEIVTVGLRPGEKLYEELLVSNNPLPTKHPKIFKSIDPYLEWDSLKYQISNLEKLIKKNDYNEIKNCISEILYDFKPKDKIVDYLYLENRRNNLID